MSLEQAWSWRQRRGCFSETEALRVFHGPGEGKGELRDLAIDRFGDHYWVTEWGKISVRTLSGLAAFLGDRGAESIVRLMRTQTGVPNEPEVLRGTPPERLAVAEGDARFEIRLLGTRHPGLFLDHAPLRSWLKERARGWRVLNAFSYTGSLSVACGLGRAAEVTTLDLSKPTIEWAETNWRLNNLDISSARFISGDVFEWLPRLKREGALFDCVILDPPSFSRGKKSGMFSTSKDLQRLHELAFDLLAPGGFVVSSINSANVSWAKFESDLAAAARAKKMNFQILKRIDLPETFPTLLGATEERYLKGFVLRGD